MADLSPSAEVHLPGNIYFGESAVATRRTYERLRLRRSGIVVRPYR